MPERTDHPDGQPTPARWPDKTVPNFTDTELADAIERHESDPNPLTREITQGCIREWERRRGIPTAGA